MDDIDINGEKHVPISYVIYDCENYIANTKDLLNQKYYWYDDEKIRQVTEADFLEENENIVMEFYIKLSSWTENKEGICSHGPKPIRLSRFV